MSDPRFESVYLEGKPRRSLFRAARARLQENCGDYTLFGDIDELDERELSDLADANRTFWVQAGDRLFPLCVGVNSIGRLPDNTVVLKDDHVSRRHCVIVVHRNGDCEVHDIASRNGTFLNGIVVTRPTPIKPGDVLNLSNRRVIFLARFDENAKISPDAVTE